MNDNRVLDIEEQILCILTDQRKDFLTVNQIMKGSRAKTLRKGLGLTSKAKAQEVLEKLKPYIRDRLQVTGSKYIAKNIPATEIVHKAIAGNPDRSPKQLAQKIPMQKGDFIRALNQLLEAGRVLCTFRNTTDCTPVLRIVQNIPSPAVGDRAAFKTAYDAVGRGDRFVPIHRIREYLGWPRERFDPVLSRLRAEYVIQLHGGNPSLMAEKEIQDSYVDENHILYLTLTWVQP